MDAGRGMKSEETIRCAKAASGKIESCFVVDTTSSVSIIRKKYRNSFGAKEVVTGGRVALERCRARPVAGRRG
jgi:hypothetical protein